MRHISIEVGTDGFATLTMDNADESVNLVSESWLAEMNEAIASLTANEAVKGVIITSGKKEFMAGADLKLLVEGYDRLTKDDALDFSQRAPDRKSVVTGMSASVRVNLGG